MKRRVPNLKTWLKFDPQISFPGRANYASLDDFLDDPVNGWIKGTAVPHPQFDDFSQFPATYDVGVVLLSQNVTFTTYGALPPLQFLETVRRAAENHFTVVGYGMQGLIKPFFEDKYQRQFGAVRLIELKSTFDAGMTAKYTNNPGPAAARVSAIPADRSSTATRTWSCRSFRGASHPASAWTTTSALTPLSHRTSSGSTSARRGIRSPARRRAGDPLAQYPSLA
jgi:hypothetical protein